MRILVLSDLHIEFGKFSPVHNNRRIDDGVDVVVLAGDIAEGVRGIRWARETFVTKEIVYVPGNHEFYGHGIDALMDHMREVAGHMGVHFLERDAVTFVGVRFLGTTLWTNFELHGIDNREVAMQQGGKWMNDFRLIRTYRGFERDACGGISIRNFTPEDARQEHDLSAVWLDRELSQGDPAKTVVVTHHAPSLLSLHPRWERDEISPCFVSDLPGLLGRSALWIHGHTHDSFDYVVQGTRVVANPRGYARKDGSVENAWFEPGLVIEIQENPHDDA